jgi:elongation factor P--(R)-beta-lysine ligase
VNHQQFFAFIARLKEFLKQQGFVEVMTPPAVKNPGIEPHLHPIGLHSVKDKRNYDYYLHTSPEFEMKKLLSLGMKDIYQLSYAFRDEPNSTHHRFQFLMLEWYRSNAHYSQILEDVIKMIDFLSPKKLEVSKKTVDELFKDILQLEILKFQNNPLELYKWIKNNCSSYYHEGLKSFSYDDLFFHLFLNIIEPEFKKIPFLILDQYPASMSALATINDLNPLVCDRFEVYLSGVEIANCFNELTDFEMQKSRAEKDLKLKQELYSYTLPLPETLLASLKIGLPKSAGIALGVERLYGALMNKKEFFNDEGGS